MFLKRKLHVLILIVLSNSVLAEDACNINGKWFDPVNDFNEYSLSQTGTTFTGKSIFEDDTCGSFMLSGAITGNNAAFDVVYAKRDNEECGYHAKAQVVFAGNCAVLKGTSTDTDSSEVNEFSLDREPIRITSPAAGSEFVISAEPHMPTFKATAEVYLPSTIRFLSNSWRREDTQTPFSWKIKIKHNLFPGRIVSGELAEVTTTDAMYEPDFSQLNELLGGELTLSVQYFHSVRDEKTYIVKGTNPGKVLIESVVTNPTLRHIACMESSYRQFTAKREGGIGFPVVGVSKEGKPGGVGLFQAYDPKPEDYEIWDWKKNSIYGEKLFATKRAEVIKKMARKEWLRLNKERKAQGLPACPKDSIPPLSSEQLDRETLRRYNAGREYKWEPRNGKNCEGKWVIEPTIPSSAEKNYVEEVLQCSIKG